MVTGYEQEEIFLMANDIGLDGFIVKPVTSSTLLDVITNTLSHHNLKNETRPHTETKYAGISGISGASILVVEDNEINREVAREILENEGLIVDLASNGLEAYNKLAEYGYKKYDLVLMDLQMPVMGGFESAMLIREKISSSELPIIAMTADVASDIKEKVKQHGMNGYVSKPINTIELFSSILEFIKPVQLNRKEKSSDALNEIKKIPAVRGLDTAKGLSIIGGNVKLYRKLLFNFADSYRQGDTELKELFSKNEIIRIGEFLHKLKGVSGNLGFTAIPALSDMIVRNLNNSEKEKIVSSIEEIAVSLKNSVEDILSSHYMKDIAAPKDKETAGKLSSSLKELRRLLDTDHSEALILIETIIDSFPDSDYTKNLDRISALLNIFDIDGARDMINTAIEQLDLGGRNA
jgi:CheY-like chemotaxis protein